MQSTTQADAQARTFLRCKRPSFISFCPIQPKKIFPTHARCVWDNLTIARPDASLPNPTLRHLFDVGLPLPGPTRDSARRFSHSF